MKKICMLVAAFSLSALGLTNLAVTPETAVGGETVSVIGTFSEAGTVRIRLFGANGRLVATLFDAHVRAGVNSLKVSAPIPSCGIYAVRTDPITATGRSTSTGNLFMGR